MRRLVLLLSLMAASWPAPAARAQGKAVPPAPPPPTLVVLLTIDQFRADYLDRFGPQLRGGLARLMRRGAWFTAAHHDHAITETAPGHATLLAGRFPRSTGIAMNSAGVGDAAAPLVASAAGPGASPARFVGTTLVDWLRARHPGSRALSVSVKDRGAILPVGRSRSDVYWYAPDGRFITSRWYRDSLPPWVLAFNARRLPQWHAGRPWNPLLADSAYRERDSVTAESNGDDIAFPHWMPMDSAETASAVRGTPMMDDITTAFALRGAHALQLGAGPHTDLLAVSYSATDYVGHRFGPDSREMHDQVLRIDRSIGVLLDSLYRLIDSARVVVVLTADHGVAPIPELAASARGGVARVGFTPLVAALRARLRAAGMDTDAVGLVPPFILVDRSAFRQRPDSAGVIADWLAASVRTAPGVRRVDRFRDLVAVPERDAIARRWSHQLPADADVAYVITLDSLTGWPGSIATHGSAYDHDSHVPLIFLGAGVRPGRFPGRVRTVDIAPTLARLVGVTPSERIDGIVLQQAVR